MPRSGNKQGNRKHRRRVYDENGHVVRNQWGHIMTVGVPQARGGLRSMRKERARNVAFGGGHDAAMGHALAMAGASNRAPAIRRGQQRGG